MFSSFFFFFSFFKPAIVDFVNCEQCMCALFTVPQITLFSNFFIKNESHSTIYTFKNYFTTVFSVSIKINSIQTHHLSIYLIKEDSPFVVGFEVFGLLSEGLLVRTNVSYMVIC